MSNPEEGSYRRPILAQLVTRLREERRFLQVLAGPRQSGKSTLVRQAALALGIPTHRASWGRCVESAVGAHLINETLGSQVEVFYWREGSKEVDFVLRRGDIVMAIEVKSGRSLGRLPGLDDFVNAYPRSRRLVVGSGGVPLEEFLLTAPAAWLEA